MEHREADIMILDNEGPLDRIAELRRQLDELKTRQTIGSDSTLAHVITTSAPYDRSGTITALGGKMTFDFSFTADRQAYALCLMDDLDVFVGSSTTPAAFYDDYVLNIRQRVPTDPMVSTWRVELYKRGTSTKTFYVKGKVLSTDTGTLS